jgi:hypothetical protein
VVPSGVLEITPKDETRLVEVLTFFF